MVLRLDASRVVRDFGGMTKTARFADREQELYHKGCSRQMAQGQQDSYAAFATPGYDCATTRPALLTLRLHSGGSLDETIYNTWSNTLSAQGVCQKCDAAASPPNVISFVKNEADFKKDLENLEKWLKEAPAWSAEKYHYLHLVAMITENEAIPDSVRHHACYMLCKHGDAAKAVGKFYGVDAAEEIKKALG